MSLASHWEIIPTFPFLSHTCAAPHKTTTPGTPKRNGRALLVQPAIFCSANPARWKCRPFMDADGIIWDILVMISGVASILVKYYIYTYIYILHRYIYILIYVYLYNLEHARFFMTNRHPTVRSNHRNGGSIFQIPAIYIYTYICIYIILLYIYSNMIECPGCTLFCGNQTFKIP